MMIFKEMKYEFQKSEKPIILAHDTYKSYEFYILSLHTHPCAYVLLTKKDKLFGNEYDCSTHINCHGGLTYSDNYLSTISEKSREKWIIGWDYAHYGDYVPYVSGKSGKKWTTEEIYEEVKDVIEQIIRINSKKKEEINLDNNV